MIPTLRDDLMVQQQLPNGLEGRVAAWQHMVAVIMLNQTSRQPVKTVFPVFMHHWPSPSKFVRASEQQVKDVIWSLGMVNVRYKRLVAMTYGFVNWDLHDATKLYGIGKYGSDSYEIFFNQNYAVEPTDKELIRYLEQEVSVY
jgi:adenine-specific DNA glycosylase